MALARPVPTEQRDPFAEEDLEAERPHRRVELGQRETLEPDRPLARTAAAQPHRHLLTLWRRGRRPLGLVPLQPRGLHPVLGRHDLRDAGLHLQRLHEVDQPLVLVVPATQQLGHPFVPGRARLGVAAPVATVGPGRPALDGDDPVRDPGQQLTVVAHEQHRLAGVDQPLLQPPFARHVEVVVGLVEQQHLLRAAQQQFQREPLLLAAGQRAHLAVLGGDERQPERRDRDGVPEDLEVVPVHLAPPGEGVGVPQLGRLVVDLHERELRGGELLPRRAGGGVGEADEELLDGRLVADRADELAHHRGLAVAAGDVDAAGVGRVVAGHDPQQGRLAGPVRPDQRGLGALADPEPDVVEQHPAVREHPSYAVDLDAAAACHAPQARETRLRRACHLPARLRDSGT